VRDVNSPRTSDAVNAANQHEIGAAPTATTAAVINPPATVQSLKGKK
jgi:hypothetical protein